MDLISRLFRLGVIKDDGCSKCPCIKVRGMDYIMYVLGRPESGRFVRDNWKDGLLEPNRVFRIPIDEAIKSINTQSMTKTYLKCTTHKYLDFEQPVREVVERLMREFRSLCLTCVRTGDDHEAHASKGQSSAE